MLGVTTATAMGIVAGLATVGLYAGLRSPRVCPTCDTRQPRIQLPTSLSQVMVYWRPCVKCGARLSARGRLLAD